MKYKSITYWSKSNYFVVSSYLVKDSRLYDKQPDATYSINSIMLYLWKLEQK